ncbi:cobalamin trafficking protein CblD-like isoform X2 [Babylonia areolata]|uniref:cobalamin trafficking protein CblD-like isoform X2 n=1 Tax=Babylonia areolata TaxID=304850 RepID=UPI003FD36880
MAARLVAPYKQCVRAYLPSLQAVVQHFRLFSSQDEYSGSTSSYIIDEPDITQVTWPDPSLGPLCSADRRFPMPGNVGVIQEVRAASNTGLPAGAELSFVDPVITLPPQPEERHFGVLVHYLSHSKQTELKEYIAEDTSPKASDMMECAAHDCPVLLRKDFADLFPDRNTMEGPFTVITLSQHTQNDMTVWSMEVDAEREQLLEMFMQGAVEICNSLSKKGFWADFVDPSTGKPFKGPHTNATFFETDERYRKLGFEIDDLGCCKVIRHYMWGTHAFVSCLFTNAPVDHPVISQIVQAGKNTCEVKAGIETCEAHP